MTRGFNSNDKSLTWRCLCKRTLGLIGLEWVIAVCTLETRSPRIKGFIYLLNAPEYRPENAFPHLTDRRMSQRNPAPLSSYGLLNKQASGSCYEPGTTEWELVLGLKMGDGDVRASEQRISCGPPCVSIAKLPLPRATYPHCVVSPSQKENEGNPIVDPQKKEKETQQWKPIQWQAFDVGSGDSLYQALGPPPPTFFIRELGGAWWSCVPACRSSPHMRIRLCELLLSSL